MKEGLPFSKGHLVAPKNLLSFSLAMWQRELQGPSPALCVYTSPNTVPAPLTVGSTLPRPRASFSFIFMLS